MLYEECDVSVIEDAIRNTKRSNSYTRNLLKMYVALLHIDLSANERCSLLLIRQAKKSSSSANEDKFIIFGSRKKEIGQ